MKDRRFGVEDPDHSDHTQANTCHLYRCTRCGVCVEGDGGGYWAYRLIPFCQHRWPCGRGAKREVTDAWYGRGGLHLVRQRSLELLYTRTEIFILRENKSAIYPRKIPVVLSKKTKTSATQNKHSDVFVWVKERRRSETIYCQNIPPLS